MTSYHVLPRTYGWAVKKEGADRVTKVFPRQSDAIRFASRLAQSVYIHDRKGIIREVTRKLGKVPIRKIKSKKRVHVIPHKNKWAVKTENKKQASQVFDNKYGAIRLAHEIADNRGTSMVVHKETGEINHIDIPPHYQSTMADIIHLR